MDASWATTLGFPSQRKGMYEYPVYCHDSLGTQCARYRNAWQKPGKWDRWCRGKTHTRTHLNSQNGRAQTGATWARHRVSNTTVPLLEGGIPETVRASCLGTDRRDLSSQFSSHGHDLFAPPARLADTLSSTARYPIFFFPAGQEERPKPLSKLSVRCG